MKREKLEYTVLVLLLIICAGVVAVLGAKYILPLLVPFLIAWLVAMFARTPSERLGKRLRIPTRIIRLIISLLAVLLLFFALFFGIWQGLSALWRLLVDLGESGTYQTLLGFISAPFSALGLAPELAGRLEAGLADMLSAAFSLVAGAVTGWVGALPGALFFLLVTVIALIYFALDLERINAFIKGLLSERTLERILSVKSRLVEVCKKYVLSYLLLMLITFGIILAGLLILGVEHAFIIAVIISLLDVLPIIGVGTVLVPWSIFQIALGDVGIGIGLAVLFVVHTVVRELVEPKIVGESLNMHPILTLVLLYAGYSLLGFFGLLLVPVVALIISVFLGGRGQRVSQ